MLQTSPPFAFLHLHTTTCSARTRRIVDLAIIRVDAHGVHEWRRLLNPERSIPPPVQARTGISNAMVTRAPLFEELAREITGMLAGHVLVAHDARAQYAVLKAAFARMDAHFDARLLCSLRLSRLLFPREDRHDLSTLIGRHGLRGPGDAPGHGPLAHGPVRQGTPPFASTQADALASHGALGHARITLQFWDKLQRVVSADKLASAVSRLTGLPPRSADPVQRSFGSRAIAPATLAPRSPATASHALRAIAPTPAQAVGVAPRYAWRLAPDLISATLTLVELGTPAATHAGELYGGFPSKAQARRWLSALAHEHGLRRMDDLAGDADFARLTRALLPHRTDTMPDNGTR